MDEQIICELRAGVFVVTLNRPEKLNALTPPLSYRLHAELSAAARDPQVRCVVLKGAGRAFCAGGDVSQFSANDPDDPVAQRSADHPAWMSPEQLADRLRERAETTVLLHTMPKPTIVMLRGAVMGAGLSLAAACDFRIADDTAFFGTAFARVGLSGDYGASYFLTKLVGSTIAREMYFLDRRLSATEAEQVQLVNRVVLPDMLEAEVDEMADRLACGPALAWRGIKQNLVLAETETLRDLLDVESRNMIRTMASQDAQNAISAFLEKKPVTFAGY